MPAKKAPVVVVVETLSMGPLKGDFLRLAKTRPLGEAKVADSLYADVDGWRTTRMLEGKAEVVGVAGRTLTEVCGERVVLLRLVEVEVVKEFEEVEEALEWLWT